MAVFGLAEENPILRPSSHEAVERAASTLAPDGSIPRPVEGVIAAPPERDIARLVGLAEKVAPRRWRTLVDEVGSDSAREPLLDRDRVDLGAPAAIGS